MSHDAFSARPAYEVIFAEARTVEIAIYGGSALMLTFDWRVATRDVDAVFEADKALSNRLSRVIESNTQFGLEEIFERMCLPKNVGGAGAR